MLRVSPGIYPSAPGGQVIERTIMGNAAVAEVMAGTEDLDELYKLSASETEPEADEDDDEDDDDEDEDGGVKKPGRTRAEAERPPPQAFACRDKRRIAICQAAAGHRCRSPVTAS